MAEHDVHVQNITFRPDGIVELTYMEERHVNTDAGAAMAITIMFDADLPLVKGDVAEILEIAEGLIDTVQGNYVTKQPTALPGRTDG